MNSLGIGKSYIEGYNKDTARNSNQFHNNFHGLKKFAQLYFNVYDEKCKFKFQNIAEKL